MKVWGFGPHFEEWLVLTALVVVMSAALIMAFSLISASWLFILSYVSYNAFTLRAWYGIGKQWGYL